MEVVGGGELEELDYVIHLFVLPHLLTSCKGLHIAKPCRAWQDKSDKVSDPA